MSRVIRAELGKGIRGWRTRRAMTQEALAAAAGVSPRHLSFVENGRSRPGRGLLTRLMEILELPNRERGVLLELAGYARERLGGEPAVVRVLETPEEVRALADPLRLDLLRAFGTPRSPNGAAELLGIPPSRVYHHVDVLERAGLIQVVETRQVRGTFEPRYRAVASIFQLGASISGARGAAGTSRADAWSVLGAAMTDLRDAEGGEAPAPAPRALAARTRLGLDAEDLAAFVAELEELFSRYESTDGDGRTAYRLTLVGFPERGLESCETRGPRSSSSGHAGGDR